MASFYIHDDHQTALEIGGVVGSLEGLTVGRDVASFSHGGKTGKTDVKVVKDADETEAAQKGGLLKLDREETKDSRRDEVRIGARLTDAYDRLNLVPSIDGFLLYT